MAVQKKKFNVLCFGYNGVNNTGSEAKLMTTLEDVKEVFGDQLGELGVLTQNNANEARYVHDPKIQLIEIGPVSGFYQPMLRDGKWDILLLSEGSTFIDHFNAAFLWMFCLAARAAKKNGMGVVAYSNDCGHLQPMSQKILRNSLNKYVDLILLRNPDAVGRMKEYGVTTKITLTADGAYRYPAPPKEFVKKVLQKLNLDPKKRPIVGVCPKEFFNWPIKAKFAGPKEDVYRWPLYYTWTKEGRDSSQRYVDQTARFCDWCVETYKVDIALIAMEHMDIPPVQRIYDAMKHRNNARLVVSDEYDVDGIVSVLSNLKFQSTTRYHSTVLASQFGIPMTSVSSDTRCESVFNELNMREYFIDYVKNPLRSPFVMDLDDRLIEMTKHLTKNEDKVKTRILKQHKDFVKRSHMNPELLQEWLKKEYSLK